MQLWQRNLYLIWAAQVVAVMAFNLSIPFIPYLLIQMGVDEPHQLKRWVGWLGSAPPIGMLVSASFWGALGDRFGRKLMLLRSLFIGSVVLLLTSLAQHPWQLFTLRLLQGFFSGTVVAATTLVAAATPARHTAMALGVLSTSQYLGATVGPMLGGLAVNLWGARPAFLAGALLLALSGTVVLLKVREVQDNTTESPLASSLVEEKPGWKSIFIWLLLAYLTLQISKMAVGPYLPLIVADIGLNSTTNAAGTPSSLGGGSASMSGVILGLSGLAGMAGGLLIGRCFGHRPRRLRLTLTLLLLAVVMQLGQFGLSHLLWGLATGTMLFSFLMNGIEPMLHACVASITPVRQRGLIFGISAQASALGWLIATLTATYISVFSLRAVFLLSAGGSMLALPFTLLARRKNYLM